jgi:hypothetical protein
VAPRSTSAFRGGFIDAAGGPSLDIDFSGDSTEGEESIATLQLGGSSYYADMYADDYIADDADWPGGSGPPPGSTVPGLFFANG